MKHIKTAKYLDIFNKDRSNGQFSTTITLYIEKELDLKLKCLDTSIGKKSDQLFPSLDSLNVRGYRPSTKYEYVLFSFGFRYKGYYWSNI